MYDKIFTFSEKIINLSTVFCIFIGFYMTLRSKVTFGSFPVGTALSRTRTLDMNLVPLNTLPLTINYKV